MYDKIEDTDTDVIYKMIQALFKYDYYSTKCLVNELLQKRREEHEINNLKKYRSYYSIKKMENWRNF